MGKGNMQSNKRLLVALCLTGVAALFTLAGVSFVQRSNTRESRILTVATATGNLQQVNIEREGLLPAAEPTAVPLLISTPSPSSTSIDTPTPVGLQAAQTQTPTLIELVSLGKAVTLEQKAAINAASPIAWSVWAPTGDKLLYVTSAGDLYWANRDGSNATFMQHYDDSWDPLHDQNPQANVLFIRHKGSGSVQGHMDSIRFQVGQAPILQEVRGMGLLSDLHWWAPDRVSGTRMGDHLGSEALVTLNSNGNVIEERKVPYMQYGAVRPGGTWFAYVTQQAPVSSSGALFAGETAYLLNMSTEQRIQISEPGKARHLLGWSPDGSWVLLDAVVNGSCGSVLVSANGQRVVTIPQTCGHYLYDAVWSPNSTKLAFSIQSGGCDAENSQSCPPETSNLYIIDVPTRKYQKATVAGNSFRVDDQLWHPSWSSTGSLAVLSYDIANKLCQRQCSKINPAIYLMTLPLE